MRSLRFCRLERTGVSSPTATPKSSRPIAAIANRSHTGSALEPHSRLMKTVAHARKSTSETER